MQTWQKFCKVSGQEVLVSPKGIDKIRWSESKVFVTHPSETFRQPPEYADDFLLSRDYESENQLADRRVPSLSTHARSLLEGFSLAFIELGSRPATFVYDFIKTSATKWRSRLPSS